jgi:hypothetical protein
MLLKIDVRAQAYGGKRETRGFNLLGEGEDRASGCDSQDGDGHVGRLH